MNESQIDQIEQAALKFSNGRKDPRLKLLEDMISPPERIIFDGSAPFERGPIHVEQQNDMITVLPKGWFNESYFTSSGWRCELFGTNPALVIHPREGQVPNAFWRWMQFICFGNKWIKEKK